MLRSVVGLRSATGQFYAGRSKHRWNTFAALEQRLPTPLACFMRRFIRGGASDRQRDLGGVAVEVDDPFLGDDDLIMESVAQPTWWQCSSRPPAPLVARAAALLALAPRFSLERCAWW